MKNAGLLPEIRKRHWRDWLCRLSDLVVPKMVSGPSSRTATSRGHIGYARDMAWVADHYKRVGDAARSLGNADYNVHWDDHPEALLRRLEAWYAARKVDDWTFEHAGEAQPGNWKEYSTRWSVPRELLAAVLIEHCGATPRRFEGFDDPTVREFRFCGALGSGGKIYLTLDEGQIIKAVVGMYDIDRTAERLAMKAAADEALKDLLEAHGVQAP